MTRLFVDIHVLQSVPPSNINRDDTGSPKSAIYGGVTRARVSSQAWKRAMRKDFEARMDRSELGVRTKRVVELVAEEVKLQDPACGDADALALAEKVLTLAGLKIEKPKRPKKGANGEPEEQASEAGYLVFLSRRQIERLAEAALANEQDPKASKVAAKAAFDQEHGLEVSLFGRMVADATDLKVDASVQVAHALSVHGVTPEFDYFTAVDDLKNSKDDEDAGAGMIGTVEFNSSTLYRYATINVAGLMENLGDAEATARACSAFVESFVRSMPTGKQNTFANRTLPNGVVVALRTDQPVNLVEAFEKPVRGQEGEGIAPLAARALVGHAQNVDAVFGSASEVSVAGVGPVGDALAELGQRLDFEGIVGRVQTAVAEKLGSPE